MADQYENKWKSRPGGAARGEKGSVTPCKRLLKKADASSKRVLVMALMALAVMESGCTPAGASQTSFLEEKSQTSSMESLPAESSETNAAQANFPSFSSSLQKTDPEGFALNQASLAASVDPAQSLLTQIARSPAETAVDVSCLTEEQIRSCFVSLPVEEELVEKMDGDFYSSNQTFITPDDLRLVRLLYTDFDGKSRVGELLVNRRIAPDIEDIFFALFEQAYPIERVVLPFGYYADDNAIMDAGITRALGFTWDENGTRAMEHEHSLGLAVDFNPRYNPQVIRNEDGTLTILPPDAEPYASRQVLQPHMMDENDLAVQLFEQHGFTWGGIWEGRNDYQHFEKGFDHETGHIDPALGN